MSTNENLITAQILAEELNLSVETIWRYTRENKIPFIELGKKQYRYKLADVIKALSSSIVKERKIIEITNVNPIGFKKDYINQRMVLPRETLVVT